MSVVIPVGYSLVAWRFTCGGDAEEMLTTCGVNVDGPAIAVATTCSDAFEAAFAENMISSSYTFRGCHASLGQDGGPPDTASFDQAYVGSADPSRYAPNTAILLKKNTGLGGRRNRGRMYLPPIWHQMSGSGVSAAGLLASSVVFDLQVAVGEWFEPLSPQLFHDSESPGTTAPTEVTGILVQSRLATQRRRLRP